ncbi:SDR family NAD(P)-dependent oxidoreductase [Blastococcus deserti]|uniref:SDR family NAD(P)-dependent oxidoreductase n=1 Tax=Blastococcus deserti TaxID=2259033 RepID=A0ABW4XCL2_9ACTN
MPEKGPRPPRPPEKDPLLPTPRTLGAGPERGPSRDGATRTLSGQVALVTGASTGIGRHLVEGLAARGMAVAGMARSEHRLVAAMSEVGEATGARTLAVGADVTDRAAVTAAVERVVAELGQVDLLVNNAGLIDAAEEPLWEADPEQWWDVVSSHVRGGFLLCRTVVPWMVLRNRGRIVNIASGMSVRARPEYSAYSVAKTGLMRLTEALAGALEGSDVRAFDVSPGVVDSPMTRSMPMWRGFEDWTPPERVVELITAIAAGELDPWSGRLLRAGADDLDTLRSLTPQDAARQLRLRPYGDGDPLA